MSEVHVSNALFPLLFNFGACILYLGISLANIKAILQRLKERFEDVTIIHQTERSFTSDEYESIEPGLFEYFVQLRSEGLVDFKDIGGGRHIFYNFFIRASGAKKL